MRSRRKDLKFSKTEKRQKWFLENWTSRPRYGFQRLAAATITISIRRAFNETRPVCFREQEVGQFWLRSLVPNSRKILNFARAARPYCVCVTKILRQIVGKLVIQEMPVQNMDKFSDLKPYFGIF